MQTIRPLSDEQFADALSEKLRITAHISPETHFNTSVGTYRESTVEYEIETNPLLIDLSEIDDDAPIPRTVRFEHCTENCDVEVECVLSQVHPPSKVHPKGVAEYTVHLI